MPAQDDHENQGTEQEHGGVRPLCHETPKGNQQIKLADDDHEIEVGHQISKENVAEEVGEGERIHARDKIIDVKHRNGGEIGEDDTSEAGQVEFLIGKTVVTVWSEIEEQLDPGEKEKSLYHKGGDAVEGHGEGEQNAVCPIAGHRFGGNVDENDEEAEDDGTEGEFVPFLGDAFGSGCGIHDVLRFLSGCL